MGTKFVKTISTNDPEELARTVPMIRGQWINYQGARGRFIGMSAAGVVWIAWGSIALPRAFGLACAAFRRSGAQRKATPPHAKPRLISVSGRLVAAYVFAAFCALALICGSPVAGVLLGTIAAIVLPGNPNRRNLNADIAETAGYSLHNGRRD